VVQHRCSFRKNLDTRVGLELTFCSSLYTLHQTAAMQQDVDNNPRYGETVKVALNTLTRMVIDIAYAFNMEKGSLNIEKLSPATQHIVCCAQQHILTAKDFNDRKWLEDFNQLRKLLGFFNQRWNLAGEFHGLHLLE
jgi:hypothetical protein